jgi:acyl dehydratase
VKVFQNVGELATAVGSHLGWSKWHAVTQEQVDLFARATGDHQWIHTHPEEARRGPYGSTIVHGYLTLSLIPDLVGEIYRVQGTQMHVNYGADSLRFPAPVRVGSQIRAGVELLSLDQGEAGYRSVEHVTVECAGTEKPVCVVEVVTLIL